MKTFKDAFVIIGGIASIAFLMGCVIKGHVDQIDMRKVYKEEAKRAS